jgi:hypothetical protein
MIVQHHHHQKLSSIFYHNHRGVWEAWANIQIPESSDSRKEGLAISISQPAATDIPPIDMDAGEGFGRNVHYCSSFQAATGGTLIFFRVSTGWPRSDSSHLISFTAITRMFHSALPSCPLARLLMRDMYTFPLYLRPTTGRKSAKLCTKKKPLLPFASTK